MDCWDKEVSLKYYYRIISAAKPKVETFTGKKWNIKDVEEYSSWVNNLETPNYGEFFSYGYMAYLRHHGFPSPLLDWTASPYIAAFFAFNNIDRKTDSVSVFVYSERAFGIKLTDMGSTSIRCLGPYVEAHKRHFFQQSNYTICTIISDQDVYYAKHQTVFERNEKYQNLLWKINIPSTEQKTALRKLNRMNINAFSLFGNEDSLLETIAISDIFLKGNI